jgi:hypothetical protein
MTIDDTAMSIFRLENGLAAEARAERDGVLPMSFRASRCVLGQSILIKNFGSEFARPGTRKEHLR